MFFILYISLYIIYNLPKYLHDIFDKKCVAKTVLVTKKLPAAGCDTETIAKIDKMR